MKIASSISPKSNYTVAGLKIEGTGSEILRSRRTKSSPSCVPRRRSEASQTETEQRERESARALVVRFLTFPRPLISTGSGPEWTTSGPSRHRYRGGQPAKSHPGEDKNEKGGGRSGELLAVRKEKSFLYSCTTAFCPFVTPEKNRAGRGPNTEFPNSNFPRHSSLLLSSPLLSSLVRWAAMSEREKRILYEFPLLAFSPS